MQKTTRFAPFSSLLLASLVALVACADPGNAPVIDELAVDPASLSVGSPTNVSASFSFADPDGDALETMVTIRTPDGAETSVDTPVVGVAGLPAGRVSLQLSLQAPSAGDYTLLFQLRDQSGNVSNVLSVVVPAS
jgi:hypothetical protein